MSKNDLQSLGLFGSMLGHIGDGNFHETILFNGEEERKKVERCVDEMVSRAINMQGTCTVSSFSPFLCPASMDSKASNSFSSDCFLTT